MTPLLWTAAGESVSLWADRALGWQDVLLVADVHLGKSAVFRAAGLPIPPGDLEHDLARLSALVAAAGPRRLVILGDFVHGATSESVVRTVGMWREKLAAELFVVRGNHDRHLPNWPTSWQVNEYPAGHREGPFALHHEPTRAPGACAVAGHVHPTVTVGRAADRLRFPGFVFEKDGILLPAFTQFSGGPVIARAEGRRRLACTPERVVPLDD